MSTSHHNPEQDEALRLISELMRQTERRWPDGRISGEDDGETHYAIATDVRAGIIRIQFTKPMNWLAMRLEHATALRDILNEKIAELEASQTDAKNNC